MCVHSRGKRGERKVESEEWKVESEEWKVESEEWKGNDVGHLLFGMVHYGCA
jgi:hypothetical protein